MPRLVSPRRFPHRLALLVAALATLTGCKRTASAGPPADEATLARLSALGGDALVVGLIDARHWEALRARALKLAPGVADPLPATPRAAAQALGLTADEAAAWATDRPIVVGAFGGSALVAAGAVGASLPLRAPTGVRHQAVIPARDAAALAAGLTRVARTLGDAEGDAIRLRAPRAGRVRITAEADAVRVVLEVGEPGPPRPAPAVATPALRALADGRAVAGAVLRPALLNDVMSQYSLGQVHEALAYVGGDMKPRLLARGLAEVVRGSLLMSAASPDVEDVGVSLRVEGEAVSLVGLASLTPAGAARLERGAATAGRRVATKPGTLASAGLAFDLGAALADAPKLPFARPADLAEGVMGCGVGCTLFLPLRMPLTVAHTLIATSPVPVASLPRAWQVAVGQDGRSPSAAVAVDVAAGFDPAPLGLPRAAIELVPRGDRATLLLSMDLQARDAFDLDREAGDAPIGEVTLARLPGWMPLAGAQGMRLTLDGRRDGQVLLARLRLAPAEAAPEPLGAPPAQAWAPAPLPASPGVPCLATVARAFADDLIALSEEKPVGPGPDAAAEACALADPATAAAARGFAAQRAALVVAPAPAQPPSAEPPVPAVAPVTASLRPPMTNLQATVRQHMPRLRACYEGALMAKPDLKARLRLAVQVDAAGRVTSAKVSGEGAEPLAACLEGVARTIAFPAGEASEVRIPLVFQTAH